MTEKRFMLDDAGELIDLNNHQFIEYGDEVCNLLNDLHKENTQLKNKLKFYNELNKPYGTIIEENKRLKSFINRLTNDCGEIVLMNGMGYNVKKIFGDLE